MIIKIITFLSIYTLHNIQTNDVSTIYLYPEEEIKMKNVCAIAGKKKSIHGILNYLYLKTHCSRNELCYETEPGYYQCGKKINLQKIGEDCGVNEECYTGICNYGKCASINDDEECTVENDPNNPEKVCNPGHWCYEYDSLNHLYKCVPFVGENEYYDEVDGRKCKIGLLPLGYDDEFYVCTKVGSLIDGTKCKEPLLCENGDAIGYDTDTEDLSNDVKKITCFSVVTDSPCEYDSSDSEYYCKPIVDGLDIYVVEIRIKCKNINDVHICPFTKGREKIFKEYASLLNGLNVDDVYNDENKYHKIGYGNNELSQAYQKFFYYYDLVAMGFIDENGDITEDKKEAWEFFWRINNSFMINFSYFFYLIILLF